VKLSIITINYNNIDGLKKTMGSVFTQTCNDFEYIIIDGASTDGSAEYIKENAEKLTYWVSEEDTGIYNAMNKGVRAAKGEYVLMLNSGDYFVNHTVINSVLPRLYGEDIIQGNILIEKEGTLSRDRGYGKSDISFFEVMDGHFLHQASFIKKGLHNKYGLYDESYKKNSDTYFYWKVLGFGNAKFKYIDIDIAFFDNRGISNDNNWMLIDQEENSRWFKENFPVRLQKQYLETPKKIRLFDNLHRVKLIWWIALLLANIAKIK